MTDATRTITTHVVGEGDDAITYDVHGDLSAATSDRPVLFLFGAPMDATGFHALAEFFTDRPVVTYDPRGAGRNPTGTGDITVQQHADDLHRVIADLGTGPVDAFGSSGGGVNLLELMAAHPEDVRYAIAHEPATAALLPDAAAVGAVVDDLKQTYATRGEGAGMAKFIQFVMFEGPVPADYVDAPAPDPAMFGMPAVDDGARSNPLFRNMPSILNHAPDVTALRAHGDRLVIGVGVESGDTMPARAGRSVADAVGIAVTDFPSHHGGFTSQPGMPGDPAGFAARLRDILGG